MKYYFATFQQSRAMVNPKMGNVGGSKELFSRVLQEHPLEYLTKLQARMARRSGQSVEVVYYAELSEEEYAKFKGAASLPANLS